MSCRVALSILVALFAGCGEDESRSDARAPAPAESNSGTPAAPSSGDADASGASPFIASMTVDPGDGTMLIPVSACSVWNLKRSKPSPSRANS